MLSKNKMLSADKLLRCRRLDKTVPPRGGAKEYAPDGTWMQEKRLEVFHQERTAVLGEQRVERLGSLVQGTWNPEKHLVEFHKEVGKFWTNMGFVDQSRKWLFPEEALFLMETTVLEVYYCGVPLSIQEGYVRLLGSEVSLEEYQAYCHLRRLGYVVLRHTGSSKITHYERRIKLDQHIKESKRHRHRDPGSQSPGGAAVDETESKKPRLDVQEVAAVHCGSVPCSDVGHREHLNTGVAAPVLTTDVSNPWNISTTKKDGGIARLCEWDFSAINFPNIGGKETVVLNIPLSKYLPPNVDVSEEVEDICLFDVREYRQHQARDTHAERCGRDSYVFQLEFSYSSWARSRKRVSARNWTEYKQKLEQNMSEAQPSPVANLWEGEVTPLVKPEQATTTREVLKLLQVIESVDLPLPTRNCIDPVKISFDVYLPNAKFKKTRPGLPHHRVCVVRTSDPPPSMVDVSQTVTLYGDNVPVLWAVIDSGDVAFYNMASISLPVDITMG